MLLLLRPASKPKIFCHFSLRLKSKASSQQWLQRQNKDIYVKKSKEDGYVCRSAYKLLEIDEKFQILSPGKRVVDCGAAPGSWTQVAIQKLGKDRSAMSSLDNGGVVISIDLKDIDNIDGAIVFGRHDFTDAATKARIVQCLPDGKADVVLSDMAPASSGNGRMDHERIMDLVFDFFQFSQHILITSGSAICKVLDGKHVNGLILELRHSYRRVALYKPKSSRSDSRETYICALGLTKNQTYD